MTRLEKQIFDIILSEKLISKNDNILLALSGGPDSVFAFHFLLKFMKKFEFTFSAVHVNHLLRGKESDEDEKFCINLCKSSSIKLHKRSADIRSLKKSSRNSLEEVARKIRYNIFDDISEKYGYTKILTAHNLSDNTETVILNLIKGTGVSGISGIPLKRGNIIRPFLSITKQEILDYLKKNKIPFRTDASNSKLDFDRNLIRNKIIPLISKNLNPKLDDSVFRMTRIIRSMYNTFNDQISLVMKKYVRVLHDDYILDLDMFKKTDEFILSEVIKEFIKNELNIEFNWKLYSSILKLAGNQTGRSIRLAKGWRALRERKHLHVYLEKKSGDLVYNFSIGGSIITEKFNISTRLLEAKDLKKLRTGRSEIISADNLEDVFNLRKWVPGDKFIPLGMKGQKKISDFLTDLKIPNKDKKNVYVLTNRNKIVYVLGLRISEEFKVTSSSKKICEICLN
ncbi:MAG: tRNA lysidine(34) synthetase TilS [Melioribacteraceae bacterium]|nr:tRNA lysidine(34) synthetase TilS [Melioribacteraceae bacterium]